MVLLVDNERIKLAANAFDRLSTTLASIGVVAPFVALIYGTGTITLTPQFRGSGRMLAYGRSKPTFDRATIARSPER